MLTKEETFSLCMFTGTGVPEYYQLTHSVLVTGTHYYAGYLVNRKPESILTWPNLNVGVTLCKSELKQLFL